MSDERTLPCGCTAEEECSECSPWGAPVHDDRAHEGAR